LKKDLLDTRVPTLVSCEKHSRCGQSLCKNCSLRKAFYRRCKLIEWCQQTIAANPRAKVQFLTLTIQNIPLAYCSAAIRTLQASSARFFSWLPSYGGYRQIEVVPANGSLDTRSFSEDVNPHIHALNVAPCKSAAGTEQIHDLW
jgi:hypothetical protein